MKHKFVHITKTGGSYFFHVCKKFDLPVMFGKNHQFVCSNDTDCRNLTIIRNPIDRFVSAYNQYANGTSAWPEEDRQTLFDPDTMLDLLHRNIMTKELLESKFVSPNHFRKQTSWITPPSRRNTILIYYNKTMQLPIQELCDFLGFKVGDLGSTRINYPLGKTLNAESLSTKTKNKIKFIYRQDYDLFYNITRNKKAFYKVIGDIDE